MSVSDSELLATWATGDARAAEALIDRHFEPIYRFFRNKVNGHVVDDLVQQTFLGCMEARARFRGECSFRTFLFQIARHQLYGYFRETQKRDALDVTVTSVRDLGTSPTGLIARRDDERLLVSALQALPIEMQLVLELSFWENLSAAEIAIVLEIPANTVYSRARRGKELLRKALFAATEHAPRTGVAELPEDLEAWIRSLRPRDDA